MADSTSSSPDDLQNPSLRRSVRNLFRTLLLIKPYWSFMARITASGLLIGSIGLVMPYMSKLLIDRVYPTGDSTLLQIIVFSILGIAVVSGLVGAVRAYYSTFMSGRLSKAISLYFFDHLQHLSASFYDNGRVGEILSRFQDVRGSLRAVIGMVQSVVVNGFYIVLVPPVLFIMDWRLALVALAATPIVGLLKYLGARIIVPYERRLAETAADLSAFQVEVLSQIYTFKTMGLEAYAYDRLEDEYLSHYDQTNRLQRIRAGLGILKTLVVSLQTAAFTWYGWHLILTGDITLGEFVAFGAYKGYLLKPIATFGNLVSNLHQVSVHFDRMYEYLDVAPEQATQVQRRQSGAAAPSVSVRGDVAFGDVSFAYVDGLPVLSDITFTVASGENVAIVGPSGAGKSTLLRLVNALSTPTSGTVSIDGAPLQSYPLSSLRQHIAMVLQEPVMLQSTLWENLTLGQSSLSQSEVDKVMEICGLRPFIEYLPDGYDSVVGERGMRLSGGQRQRFVLAQSMLRQTPILLLDEATSQIDPDTEARILEYVFDRQRTQTVMFVTHRLESAALADTIAVIENGRLVRHGDAQTVATEIRNRRATRRHAQQRAQRSRGQNPRSHPQEQKSQGRAQPPLKNGDTDSGKPVSLSTSS